MKLCNKFISKVSDFSLPFEITTILKSYSIYFPSHLFLDLVASKQLMLKYI